MRPIFSVFRLNHLLYFFKFWLPLIFKLFLESLFYHFNFFLFIWQNGWFVLVTVVFDRFRLCLCDEFVVDTVIEFAVVIVLVLAVTFPNSLCKNHTIIVDQTFNWEMQIGNMCLRWVKRSKNDWFCRTVLDKGIIGRVQLMLCKMLISIQSSCVIVCELFSNDVLLCFCKNIQVLRSVFEPDMLKNLLSADSLGWISF